VRPYKASHDPNIKGGIYNPFVWRGWEDFGAGALGDMACHTLNMPFHALNQAWVTNAPDGSAPVFNSIRAPVTPTAYAVGSSSATSIAIDISGSVWIANNGNNSVTRVLGAAAPTIRLATGVATSLPATEPSFAAIGLDWSLIRKKKASSTKQRFVLRVLLSRPCARKRGKDWVRSSFIDRGSATPVDG
jgi:hypothetical protein